MNQAQVVIDIEDEVVVTNNKKGGGQYYTQKGYFHETERDGSPKRYPTEINVFPRKNDRGEPIPYKKGSYTLGVQSFGVERGFLQLNFPSLVPVKSLT